METIFSPIPSDYIGTFLRGDIIKICGDIFTRWIQIFLIATVLFLFIFLRCVNENGQNLEKKGCLLHALATAMAIHAMYICYTFFLSPQDFKHIGVCGFIALLEMIVFACAGLFQKDKIVYYAGIYPVVYTLITIYYTGIFGIFRFDNLYFLFIVILYALFKCESHLIRMMATVSSIILIVSMILLDMNCYISEPFPYNLAGKVAA